MWNLPFHAFFNNTILFDTAESTNSNRESDVANSIYRDELSKKVKKGDYCLAAKREEEATKNLEKRCLGSSDVEDKGVIRVKVKMTKQEAARLLSKCKDGGVLEFKDVAQALVQIPMNHVSFVSSSVDVLKTIPEEN